MRLLLSVVGTRGDVQPIFALALRARDHGHDVRLCLPPNFITCARDLGFDATSVGIEMRAPRPGTAAKPIPDLIADQFDTILKAAERCDVILGANAHQYAAPSVAELLAVPYVNALYAPTALPSDENVHSWNERARDRVNANRARLGLSPIDDVLRYVVTDHPWLATDPLLSPAPVIQNMSIVQTGAWMSDDVRPLPRDLAAFLDGGEPPVYFGFGSIPVADGTGRVLIEAARAVGRRAIISRGWGGLTLVDDAPDCIEIDDVSHRALFGNVAIVAHHGGAGTTHAAARAGTPQVIVPMFGDQPYWASRVRALGVGASILPTELSIERLASALLEVLQPATIQRAEVLARQIALDGATVAARLLTERSV
jgi:vancomycin aglycone glucosyltransferase